MNTYALVKLVHVLGATVLLGTGAGIAFFLFRSWRRDDEAAFAATAAHVVVADAVFTAPAAVVQIATGLWLAWRLGVPVGSLWFVLAVCLYVFVGACWLPVVRIQIAVRDRLRAGAGKAEVAVLMRAWTALGVPAFGAMLVLFWLMVSRFGTDIRLFG